MTTIAYDGKTMAADKRATSDGYGRTTTKIFRVPDGVVGFSGDQDCAQDLLQWFRGGRVAADYPAPAKEGKTNSYFADKQGHLWLYDKSPNPTRSEGAFDAGGSGRDYALAAMHLGCTARRAVEIASQFDVHSGNGIDVLWLDASQQPAATEPAYRPWAGQVVGEAA